MYTWKDLGAALFVAAPIWFALVRFLWALHQYLAARHRRRQRPGYIEPLKRRSGPS